MTNLNIDTLIKNREEILKAEIASFFILLEKTNINKWKNINVRKESCKRKIDYFPECNKLDFNFDNFCKEVNLDKLSFSFNGKNLNLFNDLLKDWRSGKNDIQKILTRGCENINSGIDKGSPDDCNQLPELYISNAFGSLRKIVNKESLDKNRESCKEDIKKLIEKLRNNTFKFKNDRKQFKDIFCNIYSSLLSDSRFPINDVTLYEQAYMTATMFKSALAAMLLDNSNLNYVDNPQSIRWSILGIQYDKLGLAEKGLKAASIKWYRDTADEVDDKIKEIIEIGYTLGNEVYKDETGIYFLVPENAIGDKKGDFYEIHSDLNELKEKIQKIFTEKFEDEVYPAIFLAEPSRGLMNLGHLIEKAKENFLKQERPEDFTEKLKHDENPTGICQVCRMRLANKKNKDDLICNVCDGRNKNRLNNWLDNRNDETIWTGELQDKNGKIALVTLKFELDKWLNGDLVNSLVVNNCNYSQTLDNLFNELKTKNGRNKKLKNTTISDFVDKSLRNRINLSDYLKNILLERSIGHEWEKFISKQLKDWDDTKQESKKQKIDFEKRKIKWQNLNNSDIEFLSTLLLQFLLLKNPSPARLRRIWETTREFFEEILSNIVNILEIPKWRQRRVILDVEILNSESSDCIDKEYVYKGLHFWEKENQLYLIDSIEQFLKVFNPAYLQELYKNNDKDFIISKKVFEKLINQEWQIEEHSEQGKNKKTYNIKITDVDLDTYKPILSILSPTPISWQFAIPADRVPVLLKKIKERYKENFRWVYGKLPLHIGIVVQNYKKPLYVGIKALRNIRRDCMEWRHLGKELPGKDLKARQKEVFHYSAQPEKIADCENYYSLYEKTEGNGRYEFYLYTADKRKQWLDTTQNTADTDKFTIYPNTFDFEFMDTNTRRNDIYYRKDKAKRFLKIKQNRPYNLSDWQYFEKFKEYFSDEKSSSKLQTLVNIIYSKLEDWDDKEAMKRFILSSFINILELKNRKQKDDFAGILKCNGWNKLENLEGEELTKCLYMILDMFEFWHTILKEV